MPRNLVSFGDATLSTEGFRHTTTVLSVPDAHVPIALVFKSVGLADSGKRLVAVAYPFAAVAAVYLFARQLYGRTVAAGAHCLVFHMEADPSHVHPCCSDAR